MADLISNRNSAQAPNSSPHPTDALPEQYLVILTVTGDNTVGEGGYFSVSTSLDESFGLSLGSQWEAPYANVMQEGLDAGQQKLLGSDNKNARRAGSAVGAGRHVGSALGLAGRNVSTTAQVWQSSDPISFSIPFTFVAHRDAKKEVQDKVVNLLKLTAPSEFGPILKAPGPTILGQITNKQLDGRRIVLSIGKFIQLDNCIIERVDVQFDSIMGEQGIPHKAKVTVDIKSFFTCFTVQDIDKLFVIK